METHGAEVRVCEQESSVVDTLNRYGGIELLGNDGTHFAKLSMITQNIGDAVAGADLIMAVTPASARGSEL